MTITPSSSPSPLTHHSNNFFGLQPHEYPPQEMLPSQSREFDGVMVVTKCPLSDVDGHCHIQLQRLKGRKERCEEEEGRQGVGI